MCHVTFFKDFFRHSWDKLNIFFHYYYKNMFIFDFEKCHVTPGKEGGAWKNVTKCHMGEGGLKSAKKVSRII
jgi:hypothetical protein